MLQFSCSYFVLIYISQFNSILFLEKCSEECQARDWIGGSHWELCQTFQTKKEQKSSENDNRSPTNSTNVISVDDVFASDSSVNSANVANTNNFITEKQSNQTAGTDHAPFVFPTDERFSIGNALNDLPSAGLSSSEKSSISLSSVEKISNHVINNINAKRQQISNNVKKNRDVDSTHSFQPMPQPQPHSGSKPQQIPSSNLTRNVQRSSSMRPVRDDIGTMPPRRFSAPTKAFNNTRFTSAPSHSIPTKSGHENAQIPSHLKLKPPTIPPNDKNSIDQATTSSSIFFESNIVQKQTNINDSLFIFAAAAPQSDSIDPRNEQNIPNSVSHTQIVCPPETQNSFLEDVIPLANFYPGNTIRDLDDGLSENSSTCAIDEEELARRRWSDTNYGKSGLGYYNHDRFNGSSEKGYPKTTRENLAFAEVLPPVTPNCHPDSKNKKLSESASTTTLSSTAATATALQEEFMTTSNARNTVLNRAVQEAVEVARTEARAQYESRMQAALADLKRELEQKYYFERLKATKEVEQRVRMEVLELYRFRKEPDVSYLKEKQPFVFGGMESQQRKKTEQNITQAKNWQGVKVGTRDENYLEEKGSAECLQRLSISSETSDVQPISPHDEKCSKSEVEIAIERAVEEATQKIRVELTAKHSAALKEEEKKYQRQLAELEIKAAEEELDNAIGLVIGGVKGGLGSTSLKEGGTKCPITPSKISGATAKSDHDGDNSSEVTLKTAPSKGIGSGSIPAVLRKQVETELSSKWENEQEFLMQTTSEAKEQSLKELEARLTAEYEAAIDKLQQELKIKHQVIESIEKSNSEKEEEHRAAIEKAVQETEDKCKTEALINLNEKLYESKQNHAKELERIKADMEKEKASSVAAMNKKLIDAEENIKLLRREIHESEAKAVDATKEAVDKAIALTKTGHQDEIDRLKKKHEKKLQNFQALTKVDTERAVAVAVEEAVAAERRKNGKYNADEALKQLECLRTKLAESEKEREKLIIRVEVAEQWMKERDCLRAEVDKLKKEAAFIDVDGLKRQIVQKEEDVLELRTERESLQNELLILKNELRNIAIELEKKHQSQNSTIDASSGGQETSYTRQGSASSKDTELSRDYIDSDLCLSEILTTPRLQTIHTPSEVATDPRPLSLLSSFNSVDASDVTKSCQQHEKRAKTCGDSSSGIRLLILNVPITDAIEDMVDELGMWLVDNTIIGASTATHVIAGANSTSLRARTPKFMIAISRTSNILHMDWLTNSYAEKRVLDCQKYRLINDTAAEKTYNFSMLNSLEEGEKRRNEGGLLNGWNIYICEGVAGNKAPKQEELLLIIKAAGGNILKYPDINSLGKEDQAKSIVLTSTPATSEQKKDPKVSRLARFGKGYFTTSWLFDCIINQQLRGI